MIPEELTNYYKVSDPIVTKIHDKMTKDYGFSIFKKKPNEDEMKIHKHALEIQNKLTKCYDYDKLIHYERLIHYDNRTIDLYYDCETGEILGYQYPIWILYNNKVTPFNEQRWFCGMVKEWYKENDTPFDLMERIDNYLFFTNNYKIYFRNTREHKKYYFNLVDFTWNIC
jgi:hypothetical protein